MSDSFFCNLEGVLTKPKAFFKRLRKEKGINKSFKYLASILGFRILMGYLIIAFFTAPIVTAAYPILPEKGPIGWAVSFIFIYLFLLFWSFASAGFLFLWLSLFGGKASYEQTYRMYAYSKTPSLLFGWIPVIGGLSYIYTLGLFVIGSVQTHKLSMKRALIAYGIILAIIIVVLLFLGFAALSIMGGTILSNQKIIT